jgi:hypothetical protein
VTVSNDASRPSLSTSSTPDPNIFTLPRHSRCEAYSMFSAAGLLVSVGGSIREDDTLDFFHPFLLTQ